MTGIIPDTLILGRCHLQFPVSKSSYWLKWFDITADLSRNDFYRIKSPEVVRHGTLRPEVGCVSAL